MIAQNCDDETFEKWTGGGVYSGRDRGAGLRGGRDAALHDGLTPSGLDRPDQNFFFKDGTDGGLILVDLARVMPIRGINTYSCHPSTRAPQIYTVYASNGSGPRMNLSPARGADLEQCGWKRIATVNTGTMEGLGGQWAVSITGEGQSLGEFRYLLFDVHRTELDDPFGNTFYSEIDIFGGEPARGLQLRSQTMDELRAGDGKYRITIDSSHAPELTEWARRVLAPAAQEWYPRIIRELASEGFEAPTEVQIQFRGMGPVTGAGGQMVAFTRGHQIYCGTEWFRQNIGGESAGTVIHEMVHVVQQYGRHDQEGAVPGWLKEGIADYIRWFEFEPQAHGAEITETNLSTARYDAGYRISANFLNWVVLGHGREVIAGLNAAARQGTYTPAIWKQLTGQTVQELGAEWKTAAEKRIKEQKR